MGFGKKIFKGKFTSHRLFGYGASRRWWKNLRKKVGLTSKNKWARSLKRTIKGVTGSPVASIAPVSATNDTGGYQYSGRSISQLMGGV